MPKRSLLSRRGPATDKQIPILAFNAMLLLQRRWFAGMIVPEVDHHMAILLLAVYALLKKRDPLHKKTAWALIGVKDVKTGRKYIAQAEKLDLIRIERSPIDRRKELLYPTSRLEKIIAAEFSAGTPELTALTGTNYSVHFSDQIKIHTAA
jgi:hypothetical protein